MTIIPAMVFDETRINWDDWSGSIFGDNSNLVNDVVVDSVMLDKKEEDEMFAILTTSTAIFIPNHEPVYITNILILLITNINHNVWFLGLWDEEEEASFFRRPYAVWDVAKCSQYIDSFN